MMPLSDDSSPPKTPLTERAIMDYEGSTYEQDFWGVGTRAYEDRVERVALRQLLPEKGERLLEVGGGYGRLTDEYSAYESVVLMDYSLSHLQAAQERHGRSPRHIYVAADVYALPFTTANFDAVTLIRVLHHLVDVPAVFLEVARVCSQGATFILEYANARNLKAMLRYSLGRQKTSPYRLEPTEFVPMNFDFHPRYIAAELSAAGFASEARRPASYFRLGLLKRTLPLGWLVAADALLQSTNWLYSPSILTRNRLVKGAAPLRAELAFSCPSCKTELTRAGETWHCAGGCRFAIRDGIHDFRAPLS